jgi:prolipoprotein diacylglyceryltransferase
MWGIAAVVCISVGTRMAVGAGFPKGRSFAALILCALAILAGSKLLYLLEATFFPHDDYVPLEARGLLHGFRIPGGILLLAGAIPMIGWALKLDWRHFGDTIIPMVALALVFIRLGCFCNGCCFGKVSTVPWALAFPQDSSVFWYHHAEGLVARNSGWSLPVHPLQLYFLIAAVTTLAVILRYKRRAPRSGHLQLLFYALFFATTAAFEPFRENHLTLNQWLAPTLAILAVGLLAGRALSAGHPVLQKAKIPPSACKPAEPSDWSARSECAGPQVSTHDDEGTPPRVMSRAAAFDGKRGEKSVTRAQIQHVEGIR